MRFRVSVVCVLSCIVHQWIRAKCHILGHDCRQSHVCLPLLQCLSLRGHSQVQFEGCQGSTPDHHVCCDVPLGSPHHEHASFIFPKAPPSPPLPPPPPGRPSHPFTLTFPTAKPVHSNRPAPVPLAPPTAAISPNSLKCGKPGPSFFIVGGEETDVGEFPWMAILQYRMIDRGTGGTTGVRWLCAGSLIHEQYVLTAAHCVSFESFSAQGSDLVYIPISVRLGEHRFYSNPDCFTPADRHSPVCTTTQDFKILRSNVIIHPDFDKRSRSSDDIALIRLPRAATLTESVRIVCLPPKGLMADALLLEGRKPYVAGWGIYDVSTARTSDVLLKARLASFNRVECVEYYRKQHIDIVDSQLCFGGSDGKDSCNGDSGGPLFISTNSEFPEFTQVGIVSLGPKVCGLKGAPALYTSVVHYIDWINGHLNNAPPSRGGLPHTVRRIGQRRGRPVESANPF